MVYFLGAGLIRAKEIALFFNLTLTASTESVTLLLKMAFLAIELTFKKVRNGRYWLSAELTEQALSTDNLLLFGLGFSSWIIF